MVVGRLYSHFSTELRRIRLKGVKVRAFSVRETPHPNHTHFLGIQFESIPKYHTIRVASIELLDVYFQILFLRSATRSIEQLRIWSELGKLCVSKIGPSIRPYTYNLCHDRLPVLIYTYLLTPDPLRIPRCSRPPQPDKLPGLTTVHS